MKLTDLERHSALWRKLNEHLEDQLRICRLKNDGDMSDLETAKLRGRIAALKSIIALAEPSPIQVADEH